MKKAMNYNIRFLKTVFTMLVLLAMAGSSYAIQGIIVKSADGSRIKGDIRWQQSRKQYLVSTADGITMTFTPEQVKNVYVPKPAGFDKAVKDVEAGRYSSALPVLQKIMNDYKMMGWDVKATRYAAAAELGTKNPKKAVMLCENLIKINPKVAYQGDIAEIYWQALAESGRTVKLEKVMTKAIKEGHRDLLPLVQIRRADIDMKNGKYKDALVNGYLRTAYFFKNNKKYAPEAIYKAMLCFQQLNEPNNVEKMRQMLMTEYPDSVYNKK